MAETTEVVQRDIEQTRADLADKLAELSDKIAGTVETVEETVSNVTEKASETVEAVKETVSGTVESVKETVEGTVEAVKGTVSNTVEAVREAFDLRKQAEERPWLVFGGAVALGFVGGKLLSSFTSHPGERESRRESSAAHRSTAESHQPQSSSRESTSQESSGPSWLGSMVSNVSQKFGSELNTLKGLALGALFGTVRDMVTQHLPSSLKDEVGKVMNNITETVGGKPIQGQVFGEDDQHDESEHDQHQGNGGPGQQSSRQQQGHPAGAGQSH